jgi:hypothetical protein
MINTCNLVNTVKNNGDVRAHNRQAKINALRKTANLRPYIRKKQEKTEGSLS